MVELKKLCSRYMDAAIEARLVSSAKILNLGGQDTTIAIINNNASAIAILWVLKNCHQRLGEQGTDGRMLNIHNNAVKKIK